MDQIARHITPAPILMGMDSVVERDVAADQLLEPGADLADDAARAHDNAAHQPEVARDRIAWEVKRARHESVIERGHLLVSGLRIWLSHVMCVSFHVEGCLPTVRCATSRRGAAERHYLL